MASTPGASTELGVPVAAGTLSLATASRVRSSHVLGDRLEAGWTSPLDGAHTHVHEWCGRHAGVEPRDAATGIVSAARRLGVRIAQVTKGRAAAASVAVDDRGRGTHLPSRTPALGVALVVDLSGGLRRSTHESMRPATRARLTRETFVAVALQRIAARQAQSDEPFVEDCAAVPGLAHRVLLRPVAKTDASTLERLWVDIPAHRTMIAGIDTARATLLDRARSTDGIGIAHHRRAARRAPRVQIAA